MAVSLPDDYKAKTRLYLSYPMLTDRRRLYANQLIILPQHQLLETAMDSIFDEYTMELIKGIIDNITCIREQIQEARKRLSMTSIAYVGDLNNKEIAYLWKEDKGYCEELATQLQTPLYWHRKGGGVSNNGQPSFGSYMEIDYGV